MDRQFSTSEEVRPKEEGSPWTRQKIFVLLIMLYTNFCTATCWSLPAPFFPLEAEMKGATPTIYGFVFGAFQLTSCIFAPVLAKLLPVLQVKFLLNSGIFVAGCCSVLFGCLEWCPPGTPFISLAFIVRIVEALGVTAYFTSVYSLIPIMFPDKIATAISLMETVFGIGSIAGPTVGGALYQIGGYYLPFMVMGILLLTGALLTYISFPNQYSRPNEEPADIKKMLFDSTYLVDMTIFCMCFLCLGFNEATLEPHIRIFNLQPVVLGLIFVISGAIYAVSAPFWGFLTDRNVDPQLLCIMGCFSCAICFLIIGPAPFLGFKATLPVVIVSQVFLGIGVGSKLICSYMHAMKDLLNRGFPDNVATYGLFSGLSSVFSSGGSFIGPSMGGALMDYLGYANATMFVVALESIVITTAIIFWIRKKIPSRKSSQQDLLKDERKPLLGSKNSIPETVSLYTSEKELMKEKKGSLLGSVDSNTQSVSSHTNERELLKDENGSPKDSDTQAVSTYTNNKELLKDENSTLTSEDSATLADPTYTSDNELLDDENGSILTSKDSDDTQAVLVLENENCTPLASKDSDTLAVLSYTSDKELLNNENGIILTSKDSDDTQAVSINTSDSELLNDENGPHVNSKDLNTQAVSTYISDKELLKIENGHLLTSKDSNTVAVSTYTSDKESVNDENGSNLTLKDPETQAVSTNTTDKE